MICFPCFLSVYSSGPPFIHVESPSFKTVMMTESTESVKSTCLVRTVLDAKVTWLMDGKPSTTASQVKNTTHIVSEVTVSLSEWKQLKSITCKAEHKCFPSTERTVSVAGKMTIQHENQTSCDSRETKRIHYALFSFCIIKGLQLQPRWLRLEDPSKIC